MSVIEVQHVSVGIGGVLLCVCEPLCEPSAVLQIASVPNYRVLMKACTPGGPTEDRLGTSPVPLRGAGRVTTSTES